MKKLLFILIGFIFFTSCLKRDIYKVKQIDLPPKGQELVNGVNSLGFDIMQKLTQKCNDKNVMISPMSLGFAMSMLYNGAEGETGKQLESLLNLNGTSRSEMNDVYKAIIEQMPGIDKNVEFDIANGLFADNNLTIKDAFTKSLQDSYFAECSNLDFSKPSSVDEINKWVNDNTKGKIPSIVDNLDGMSLVLLNALYFEGQWHYKFAKSSTTDMDFTLPDSSIIKVPTMILEEKKLKVSNTENMTIVELPYSQGNFVMDLMLPDEGYTTDSVISKLKNLSALTNDLSEIEVSVYLPKFEFSYERDLSDYLKSKAPLIFSYKADFSGIAADPLWVSMVKQKNYIKTDENGTTAASSTGLMMMGAALPMEIHFNRPFVFVIREVTTNLVLFTGKISNPSKK